MELQNENETSLFRKALPFLDQNESQLKLRGQNIIASSEGDQIRTETSGMISQYISDIKLARDQIIANVFQLKIFASPSLNCFGGGSSDRTYYLPEGGTLRLNYSGSFQCGSAYQKTFDSIPVVEEGNGASFFGVGQIKILIDSSELLQLRDGSYPFANIKIESDRFSLKASNAGIISVSGTLISIKFLKPET